MTRHVPNGRHMHVTFAESTAHDRDTNPIECVTQIDSVPYLARGATMLEAFGRLLEVLCDHGAPAPGAEWSPR